MDPLAEKHSEWSPYNYVLNNPSALIDPDGKQIDVNVKETNQYWENVAVVGHQRGGVGGVLQAAGATAMLTGIEFLGLNQADRGFDLMADGRVLAGAAIVGLAVLGDLPGGRALQAGEDAVRFMSKGALRASREAHVAQEAAAAAGRSWTTQRRAFWRAEAKLAGAGERWGAKNVERMKKGLAPQIDGASVELHHTPVSRRAGGTTVQPVTPKQHAQVDPFRRVPQP